MGLRSKLNTEYKGMFFFAVFYLIAGVVNFIILGVYDLGLFHIALVAVLSVMSAYGLYRLQGWTLWPVVGLFFIATTYAAIMLNVSIENYTANQDISNLFTTVVWIMYLLLTWIATIYVAAKRKNLK